MSANHGENLGKVVISERGGQGGGGLDEVEGPGSISRTTSWCNEEQRSGVKPTYLVRRSWVGLDKKLAELSKDAKPDPCVQGDLVAHTDTTKVIRQGDWVLSPEEPGEQLTNTG